jgi:hypothetical protein
LAHLLGSGKEEGDSPGSLIHPKPTTSVCPVPNGLLTIRYPVFRAGAFVPTPTLFVHGPLGHMRSLHCDLQIVVLVITPLALQGHGTRSDPAGLYRQNHAIFTAPPIALWYTKSTQLQASLGAFPVERIFVCATALGGVSSWFCYSH